ncbi:hypothetical protein Hanom_Chr15g01340711 [Helianthus anomalus]
MPGVFCSEAVATLVEVDQSPTGISVNEEVREVGGEEPPTAVAMDTCMGGSKDINDKYIPEVGQGRNILEQFNCPSGSSYYRFSSVGPSKLRRRPRSALSHKPKNRAQLFSSSPSEEPRPKKRGRMEDGNPFYIDRLIGNMEVPREKGQPVDVGPQSDGVIHQSIWS